MPSIKAKAPHKRWDAGESNRRNLRRRRLKPNLAACTKCTTMTPHNLVSIHTADIRDQGRVWRTRTTTLQCTVCNTCSSTSDRLYDVTPTEYRMVCQRRHVGRHDSYLLYEQRPPGTERTLVPGSSSLDPHSWVPDAPDSVMQTRRGTYSRWETVRDRDK